MPDTPQTPAAAPPDVSPAIPARVSNALMTAAVLLSSFRNKTEKAGYPFIQPPGVRECLNEIDAILYPPKKYKK